MNKIEHKIFGLLERNHHWWEKDVYVKFFDKNIKIRVAINGEEDARFDQIQIDAFKQFFDNVEKLILAAENSIYNYYQEECPDYRDRLEDSADQFAPIISSAKELSELVQLKEVIFPWPLKGFVRKVGLLLSCTWEPEHGLAVVFEDEEIVDVGYQDIIL